MAKRAELTTDEMNMVNGGYIVEGHDGLFYAIKDSDGSISDGPFYNPCGAMLICSIQGQHETVLTSEGYRRKYGEEFPY